ncbi:tripartite tricarboxylate transporter substrate binding protein [Ramlibacter sp. AW1]|uniref:Tripartite tricarboxylate transporter substrate binding protein n=1 Tax=Ramlibacter aurantiacus TaxID=2801330 RepID=A0A936ZQZ8_9BURK|nr:tripartite tricarboxylate transporter substrate binding protein [Ramlibacter aurantiacus]MBL0421878.1 tripartite tricarboxylate transporter substrate binding protein [Ramlibacter aurantiacus]
MSRRTLMLAGAALPAMSWVRAQGAGFPERQVRIVSAFPAGLSPDAATRLVAERMSRSWSQPVVIEPRPGANGFLATGAVMGAPADGHTLLLASNAHFTINPALMSKLPYDPERDFVPVSLIYRAPFFLYVGANSPYQNVGQLVAAAAKSPGRISYASPYVGSPPHLGCAALAHLSGTDMMAVQFKDSGPLIASVVTGEVDFLLLTKGSAAPMARAGRLRLLAAATERRVASDPEVPTVRESGGPAGVDVQSWVGLLARRDTPPELVQRLAAEIGRASADATVRERLAAMGVDPAAGETDLAATFRRELAANAALIKRVGIRAE